MAFIEASERVAETSTTTGTGAFALSAAVSGYKRFNAISGIATGDTLPYFIVADDGTWEGGIGTYSAADTLTRTTVQESSNSNAAVTFAAGGKTVFLGYPGLARLIAAATSKTTPVAADIFAISDSAASGALKGLTFANLKAALGGGYTFKTANYTAVAGDQLAADTSAGSFTITLPAAPASGDVIQIADAKATFSQFPLTVSRNGKTIQGLAEDLIASSNSTAFALFYNGSDWRVI